MQAQKISSTEWIVADDTGETHKFFARPEMSGADVLADFEAVMNPPAPTTQQIAEAHKRRVTAAIDVHVEAVAKSRSYNGAAALAGYATSTVPEWAAEAQAFIAWRDQVWQAVYAALAQVEAGTLAMPTPAEAVAMLPAIQWPE